MISDFFFVTLYQPIYNALIFLVTVVPYADVGIAVVVLTLLVKVLLFPLTHKSTKAQAEIRRIQPEMEKIKETHKNDRQEQSRKMIELYQKHGINPFSGCLLFLVQFPIIIALYWVFWRGLEGGVVNAEQLYSFVTAPVEISMNFLGILDISGRSVLLALLAAISQYYQMKLAMPPLPPRKEGELPSLKADFAKSFNLQMRYGLPIIVFFVAYTISAVIALYWFVSNIFTIGHELFVKRKAEELLAEDDTLKDVTPSPSEKTEEK